MTPAQTLAIARRLRALRPAKKRRAPLPRPLPPTAIERAYFGALRRWLQGAFALVERAEKEIVGDLAAQVATEAEAKQARTDDRDPAGARRVLARIRREFEASIDLDSLHRVARKFGKRLSKHQQEQLDRQVRAAVGVDWKSLPHDVTDLLGAWERQNVDLIVTVPERYFDRLEHDVESAYMSGQRPETLAKRLRARAPMAENDARRIARDQISKLNGRLARERQTRIGVTGYTWRGMHDNRERDCHVDLDGTAQSWASPPMGGGTNEDEPGHPGDGILCRCFAEPDLSGILG